MEAEYEVTFLDSNGKVIYSGAKSGVGVKAKNTSDAVKKAKENMKDFPGAKKVRLAVTKGKTASKIGDFDLNESNEDILVEATTEAKFIRDEIKKRFKLTNRDVAVKAHNYSMGSSVRVEIKSPKALPFYNKIKEIGSSKERVHRDDFGNILGGGNTYIFVEIDWKFRDKLIKKIEMDFLKQVTGDYMNDIGTNTISMYGDYAIYKEKGKKEFHAIHKKKSSAGRALFSVIEAAGALLHLMIEYDDVTALKKLV